MAADRRHPQGIWWIASDVVVAALFTWITVVSLRSPAYVDLYGEIEGAGWLLALSPNALLLIRRHAPVLALGAAGVLYLLASATQGDSNAPLALPFFTYSVGLTRPPRVSAPLVGAVALALSTTTFYGPGDPDALVIVVCRQGFSSSLAAASLQAIGLPRATDIIGGVEAWIAAGLPLSDAPADVRR